MNLRIFYTIIDASLFFFFVFFFFGKIHLYTKDISSKISFRRTNDYLICSYYIYMVH